MTGRTEPPKEHGPPILARYIGGFLALVFILALIPLLICGCGIIILVFLILIIAKSMN